MFDRSIKMLEGDFDYEAYDKEVEEKFRQMGKTVPARKHLDIPGHNKDLFEAASNADVFGGMGSWNDSPAGVASGKGLEKEYNELSDKLFNQIAVAIMYSINQW